MADAYRLAVLKSITEFLKTEITLANAYPVELDGSVFRGRLYQDEDDPLPMISILEGVLPDQFPERPATIISEVTDADEQKDTWDLLFQGWVKDDKSNPSDPAYQLLACTKQALFRLAKHIHDDRDALLAANDPLYAVISISISPGVVRPPVENSEKAVFWLRIGVEIVEKLSDPFHTP